MPEVPQNVVTVTQNVNIIDARQLGAYDDYVRLEGENTPKKLIDVVKELQDAIYGNSGTTVENIAIQGEGKSNVTASTFENQATNGKLVYVPSLGTMGYDNTKYKLQARFIAVVSSNTAATDLEVDLLNMASNTEVLGSLKAHTIATANDIDVIQTDVFDLAENVCYAGQIRNVTATGTVSLFSFQLLINVVKI